MRFLITERPNDIGMGNYMEQLKKYGVSHVVRVCEATYSTEKLKNIGIEVVDLLFPDGTPPPPEVIELKLLIIAGKFYNYKEQKVIVLLQSKLSFNYCAFKIATSGFKYQLKKLFL